MMRGWKTWVGVLMVATSAVLRYFEQEDIANLIITVGASMGLLGIGSKIDKVKQQN